MSLLLDHYTFEQTGTRTMDRRRSIRVRQLRPVKVLEPSSGRFLGGRTLDVSSTGLQLELPIWTAVNPGKVINVHVGLSRQGQTLANRRNMMPARVVWIDRQDGATTLNAGVEFLSSISAHLDAA